MTRAQVEAALAEAREDIAHARTAMREGARTADLLVVETEALRMLLASAKAEWCTRRLAGMGEREVGLC